MGWGVRTTVDTSGDGFGEEGLARARGAEHEHAFPGPPDALEVLRHVQREHHLSSAVFS